MTEKTTKKAAKPKTEAPIPPMPELGARELNAAMQVIDLATSRGAFHGNEASTVGWVYQRLLQAHSLKVNELNQGGNGQ